MNPSNVDYGLFRAARFHNPPCIRALMVLSHHYALIQGRANTHALHLQASLRGGQTLGAVIIIT